MVGVGERTPLLRGWSHALAILPATVGAAVLVAGAHNAGQRAALTLYGVALVLLFTISALYHRGSWSPRVQAIWRRIDHANIFLMIAATYTAIGVIVLDGTTRTAILTTVWVIAVAGIILTALPVRIPRALSVVLYVVTGWIAIVALPALVTRAGFAGLALLLAGAVLYTLGAVAYGMRRPRLWPQVFGYHELFHVMVIAASAMFFAFVAVVAAPGARL